MKTGLNFRLSQNLALTPQLQQSIRLLQLSTLELAQEVEQALAENPLLERENEWLESPLRVTADGSINFQNTESYTPSSTSNERTAAVDEPQKNEDHAYESEYAQEWGQSDYAHQNASADDEHSQPQIEGVSINLREHLLGQMQLTHLGVRDRGLITFLIESLDEDGYLSATLDELLGDLPEELEIELDELQASLHLLQSFDPPGVGALNAADCLGIQLRRLPPYEFPADIVTLAQTICRSHLEWLAAREYSKLRKALQVDDESLKAAHELIRSLNPFPGQAFGRQVADYVVPDVSIRKTAHGWVAELNNQVMPKLRINDLYAQILRSHKGETQASGLQQKLQEARWLIRNIQQRFDTILRVSQAIVERQKNFFTHGEIAMRPLVLREIADTLGLHESTISRVTTNKFMATPMGTFELKYFFGSHVSTDTGGAASSTAIRALIKQLIGAEEPKSPLSDSRIAELLGEQGFVVARRTVAKYREALKIPAVNLRKSL